MEIIVKMADVRTGRSLYPETFGWVKPGVTILKKNILERGIRKASGCKSSGSKKT